MRLKKGFTLAEILIVLMVIGVIATMTVPSMMKNVQDAQYKTGLKKAYNTLANMTAKFGVEGKMPIAQCTSNNGVQTCKAEDAETSRFFVAMMENLSVREVTEHSIGTAGRGVAGRTSAVELTYNVDNNTKVFGTGAKKTVSTSTTWKDNSKTLWITTDDGIAYTLITGGKCESKNDVSQKNKLSDLLASSCMAVLVDINGLNKTPNVQEPQSDGLGDADMEPLTGDQYRIFIARDGIVAGSRLNQAAARIVADMK